MILIIKNISYSEIGCLR